MSMRRLIPWLVISGHCSVAGLALAQPGVPRTLGGIWAFEAVLGPAARGPVVLRQLVGGYSAQVGGFEARGIRQGDSIRFELPGHQGAFRGVFRYEANGNGGQFLIVVPELDIAIAFTAGNYGMYGVWRKLRDEIVPRMILPAVVRGTSR